MRGRAADAEPRLSGETMLKLKHFGKIAQTTAFFGVLTAIAVSFQNCGGPAGLDLSSGGLVESSSTNLVEVSARLFDPAVPEECIQVGAGATIPTLKWQWLPTAQYLNFDQVMSAPVVGDINGDGKPEVVATYFSVREQDRFGDAVGTTYTANGVIRIINGSTGRDLMAMGAANLAPMGSTTPLLVDLDSDGTMEIVYQHYTGTKIVALNSNGTLRWTFPVPETIFCMDGLSAYDLDKNGRPEIITSNYTIEEDATRQPFKKVALQGQNGANTCKALVLATKNDQSDLKILTFAGIFNLNGTVSSPLNTTNLGLVAIGAGDVRPDVQGNEVVRIAQFPGTGSALEIINASTGALLSTTSLDSLSVRRCPSNTVGGGPLTIGNFDDDPSTMEVAVATGQNLMIFNGHGQLLAASETQDCSSLQTGMSSFDFNGDGKPELLYGDEEYFRIYSYRPGKLLEIFKIVNPTGTLLEYPVVADIDGNGTAELLVAGNNYAVSSFYKDPGEAGDVEAAKRVTGIRAFTAQINQAWMKTRPIWNQHYYQPSLVSDRGVSLDARTFANSAIAKGLRINQQLSLAPPTCVKKTDVTKGVR